MWIYLNDRFVKQEEAVVSVFDHGFLYGDGVYETIRSYGSRIFMRDLHLARLRRSADAIGLMIPISEQRWPPLLHEAMTRNDVGHERTDAYLRITISRGAGDIGLDPALCPTPTVVLMTKPLHPPSPEQYRVGVKLIVARTRRNLPSALSPQVKATNFLNNIMAKREAIAAGAFDSILLNWESHLTECTVSNIFFVRAGRLCTPALACGLLDGITRDIVIGLAQEKHIPVDEGQFGIEIIHKADECFITNTSLELMPVSIVDGHPVGNGAPGPVTQQLHAYFVANKMRFLEP
jgi:branched-chain amino acid aminotransferase